MTAHATTTPQTPAQWAYAWIEALRSGRYRKAVGMLKGGANTFCAQGVLCEIAITHGRGQWWEGMYQAPDGLVSSGEACGLVIDLIGGVGRYDAADMMARKIVVMNDFQGATFDEIADEIEAWATKHGLFVAQGDAQDGRDDGADSAVCGVLPDRGDARASRPVMGDLSAAR